MKTPTDLIDGATLLAHPSKHLLHSASFVKNNLKAGFTATLLLVHVAIPIGGMAQDTDTSLLRSMTLPSSAPFEEFGSFVFSNDPLDL